MTWARGVALLLAIVTMGRTRPASAVATTLRVDTTRSRLVVHVLPRGILSPALHVHRFVPAQWSGTVNADAAAPDRVQGDITIVADSLHDEQPELSKSDVATVENQMRGPQVLDVGRYPTVHFEATGLRVSERSSAGDEQSVRGTLTGTLALHGRTGLLDFPVQAHWSGGELRVDGIASFDQSAFGITPYATFFGVIAVQDRVTIEFALVAVVER